MSGSSDNIPVRDWTLSNGPVNADWVDIHRMVAPANPGPLTDAASQYEAVGQLFVAAQEALLTRATALSNAWSGESPTLIQKQLAQLHDAAGQLAGASGNFQTALTGAATAISDGKQTIIAAYQANETTVNNWDGVMSMGRAMALKNMTKEAQTDLEKANANISKAANQVPPSVNLTLPKSNISDGQYGGHAPSGGNSGSSGGGYTGAPYGGSSPGGRSGSRSGSRPGSGHGSTNGRNTGHDGGANDNHSTLQGGGHPNGPGGSGGNHNGKGLGPGRGLGDNPGTQPPTGPNGPGLDPFGLGPRPGDPGNGPGRSPYRGPAEGLGPDEHGLPGDGLPGGGLGPEEAAGLNGRLAARSGVLGAPAEASGAAGLESTAASAIGAEGGMGMGMGMPMMGSGMGGSESGKDRQTADWLRNENELWGFEGDIAPAVIE